MYNYPYLRPNLISRSISLIRGIKWGELLDNTGKTLGVINQAIPIINQVKPIINNTKTLFKIADSFKNIDLNNEKEKPIFYI